MLFVFSHNSCAFRVLDKQWRARSLLDLIPFSQKTRRFTKIFLKAILVVRVFSTRILAKSWKNLYIFTWLTETLILVTLPFRKIRKNLEKSVKSFCLVGGVRGLEISRPLRNFSNFFNFYACDTLNLEDFNLSDFNLQIKTGASSVAVGGGLICVRSQCQTTSTQTARQRSGSRDAPFLACWGEDAGRRMFRKIPGRNRGQLRRSCAQKRTTPGTCAQKRTTPWSFFLWSFLRTPHLFVHTVPGSLKFTIWVTKVHDLGH